MQNEHKCHEEIIQMYANSIMRESLVRVARKINESYSNNQIVINTEFQCGGKSQINNKKCKIKTNNSKGIAPRLSTSCTIHCIRYFGTAGYTIIDDIFDNIINKKTEIAQSANIKEEFVFSLFYLRITWWLVQNVSIKGSNNNSKKYIHTSNKVFKDYLYQLNLFEESLLFPPVVPYNLYKRSAPAIIPFLASRSTKSKANESQKNKNDSQKDQDTPYELNIQKSFSSRQLEDDYLDSLKDLDFEIITPITCLLKENWNSSTIEEYVKAWKYHLHR